MTPRSSSASLRSTKHFLSTTQPCTTSIENCCRCFPPHHSRRGVESAFTRLKNSAIRILIAVSVPVLLAFQSNISASARFFLSSFLLSPSEADGVQFSGERLCLLGCEFDQRRPHRSPRRIVGVDRNGLFQRSDHRRKLPVTEHLTHDI